MKASERDVFEDPGIALIFTHNLGCWTQGVLKLLRGRGGLFQNRETKNPLPDDQL
jgi:hypothetical protein